SAQAESIEIDNFSNLSISASAVNVFTNGSYSVSRTIVDTSNFNAFGDGWASLDFGGVTRFQTVAEFDYTTNGVYTFGDIWDVTAPSGTNYPVDSISFGYTSTNSNYTVNVRSLNGTNVTYDSGDLALANASGATFSLYDYVGDAGVPALDNATNIELVFKRVNTTTDSFFAIDGGFSIVPEPTAAFLFGSALFGFTLRRRR
ncbi:MAG: PEP-CTERM sorting domain-containing protein, partial [Planctomycetaceae bacterium]|nr:PEP-CTERM sorting domain-containing protein [Planctomycetaceae bacterium]